MRKNIFVALLGLFFIPLAFSQDISTGFYWDSARNITSVDSRFPKIVSRKNESYIFFQELVTKNNEIYISFVKTDESGFTQQKRLAGPFSYSGEIPDIYSCALNEQGVLTVAVMTSSKSLGVFTSSDGGENFESHSFSFESQDVVGPRIFACSDGNFILFATSGSNENFKLYFSESTDGLKWSDFALFQPTQNFTNPFSPHLIPLSDGRNIVVFQAQINQGNRFSYQVYSTTGDSTRKSWSTPILITGEETTSSSFTNYHNQRPYAFEWDGKIYVTYERTHYTSDVSHVWVERLNNDGSVYIDSLEKPLELNSTGNAHRPILFEFSGNLLCVWFDNRFGTDTVYLSQKKGAYWSETKLVQKEKGETFAYPLITEHDGKRELSFIWQQRQKARSAESRIAALEKDRHVEKPILKAQNFTVGKRSGGDVARVYVTLPADSSGIAGYSWIFTQDENAEVPKAKLFIST